LTKPEILMMGPYPQWDMGDLEARYNVRNRHAWRTWRIRRPDETAAQA
jgi:hypothetical protein